MLLLYPIGFQSSCFHCHLFLDIFWFPLWFLQWSLGYLVMYCLASMCSCFFMFFPCNSFLFFSHLLTDTSVVPYLSHNSLFCFVLFLTSLFELIVLQWCVSFCFIVKWISYTYTYVLISLPSCVSLPPTLPIPPL